MEGSLPNSLKHIISNAEYYGPSLFLLATDVVTAYVFQVSFLFLLFVFTDVLIDEIAELVYSINDLMNDCTNSKLETPNFFLRGGGGI